MFILLRQTSVINLYLKLHELNLFRLNPFPLFSKFIILQLFI